MIARRIVAAGGVVLAITLTGCSGDSWNVDTAVHAEATSAVRSFLSAVDRRSWRRACSLLTLEARIEVAAVVQQREDRDSRPPCERALAGVAFRKRCRSAWESAHSTRLVYRVADVGGPGSKPTVAWLGITFPRRLTGRCELRLTREDSDDADWRIDAIALERSRAVLAAERNQLVLPNGELLSQPGVRLQGGTSW